MHTKSLSPQHEQAGVWGGWLWYAVCAHTCVVCAVCAHTCGVSTCPHTRGLVSERLKDALSIPGAQLLLSVLRAPAVGCEMPDPRRSTLLITLCTGKPELFGDKFLNVQDHGC